VKRIDVLSVATEGESEEGKIVAQAIIEGDGFVDEVANGKEIVVGNNKNDTRNSCKAQV